MEEDAFFTKLPSLPHLFGGGERRTEQSMKYSGIGGQAVMFTVTNSTLPAKIVRLMSIGYRKENPDTFI